MKLLCKEVKVLQLGGNQVQGCKELCQEDRGVLSCKDREVVQVLFQEDRKTHWSQVLTIYKRM